MLCVALLGWGKDCIRFLGRLDQNFGFHLFSVVFDPIHCMLAGNKDMHNISDEFEFGIDRTADYGLPAFEV